MSHELYKRHRPKSLARVVGNEETVASLEALIEDKTIPHMILFHGPSGCGKTSMARIVAKELGCSKLDLVERNSASMRGVDTVRDVIRTMNLAPTGGPVRVEIWDEVHQLTKDAQEASLKLLEDTPNHIYFFLCTTNPQKLLPTIRSRATCMEVKFLSQAQVESLVSRVARKEGIEVADDVLSALVTTASGSARNALVLLDKIRLLPEEKRLDALRVPEEDQAQAIDLCRLLLKKAPWKKVAKVLRDLKTDPEQVRWSVLMYARQVLLSTGSHQAYVVLTEFEDNWYDSKEAGLARACFGSIFGE